MLACRGVGYWYGGVVALADVSFELGEGVWALLGPNGAGKSTLLRLLAGQLRPRRGSVSLRGAATWADPAARARLGLVPEGAPFLPGVTVGGHVDGALRLRGYPRKARRALVPAALEAVDLGPEAARLAETCSKGMGQRLKLAMALAHDPDVLLLDEPFSGIDPVRRAALFERLRDRAARSLILLSTHVLHEAERLADRALMLRAGKLLAAGPLDELRRAIDRRPVRLTLRCRAPRALAAEVVAAPHVRALQLADDDELRIETTDADACYDLLAAWGARGELSHLSCPDASLEALFNAIREAKA